MGVNYSSSLPNKYRLPPSSLSCNKKSKKRRKRRKRKKKNYLHESSSTFASQAGDEPSTAIIHLGGISLVIDIYTRNESPTFVSHVDDDSPTFVSHVGGKNHISIGKESLISIGHIGDSPLAIVSHVEGIDVDHRPRHRIFKPKFPRRLCKGDHLTHFFLQISLVQRLWSESEGSYTPKTIIVSQ